MMIYTRHVAATKKQGDQKIGSRTKNWNKKPGDPSFENGYNQRERMRKQHAAKKRHQATQYARIGIAK